LGSARWGWGLAHNWRAPSQLQRFCVGCRLTEPASDLAQAAAAAAP
jgi:hypothetical protein